MEESLLNDINPSKLDTSQFLVELPYLLVRYRLPPEVVQLIQDNISNACDQRYKEGYELGYSDGFLGIKP